MVGSSVAPKWPLLALFLWNGSSKIIFFTDIWYSLCWRLLRPANANFLKNGCDTQKFPMSAFQNHLQTKSNLHIFICQSQFISAISMWDTLYVGKRSKEFRSCTDRRHDNYVVCSTKNELNFTSSFVTFLMALKQLFQDFETAPWH